MPTSSKAQRSDSALKITLVYVFIGSIWVILSDSLIDYLQMSAGLTINSSKGLFYIAITALILYFWVKRLKKALTESEERYRVIVEHSPEPIAVHCEGKIVFINPAGAIIFGAKSPDQLIGLPLSRFIHPDYKEIVQERIRQALVDNEATVPIEEKVFRLDGTTFDVEIRSVPITYLGKPAVQLLCRDITERKRTQRKLEEKEQGYKSLVAHNPDAIFTLDFNGRMIDMNSATEKIMGYRQDELLHQSFFQHMIPVDQEAAFQLYERSVNGESNSIETAITHKDGKSVDLNLKWVPIIVNDKVDGVYGIAKDITERKRTEELLIKSEKLSVVGQLAAGVAHEIRNPLTSLRGFVQLLQMKTTQFEDYFQIMLSELDRINDIVSEFMVIAKPQAVKFEMKDIHKIVHDVISLLETQAILSNIQIHTEFAQDLPFVKCQENQLKQVFINVLKNAMESMPGGGHILIQMMAVDGNLAIRFIDEGCGISEERIAMLGEPFYTTKEKGTGLGLMVCHKIMEAHRGSLRIHSQLEQGTTVELTLPLQSALDKL
ncbi:PAS domain-containing sensor histidine kinase [Paenibacillus aestuarii]|uniref:histidine kinase n=1 Tax=Paenibacillus aestuarii TaxID=516965 RepID=A0ABW0K346_9BACL|nr:PAS domain S-box protein [Paenibacillus aestuarii]